MCFCEKEYGAGVRQLRRVVEVTVEVKVLSRGPTTNDQSIVGLLLWWW
jgi:hypothetical protein